MLLEFNNNGDGTLRKVGNESRGSTDYFANIMPTTETTPLLDVKSKHFMLKYGHVVEVPNFLQENEEKILIHSRQLSDNLIANVQHVTANSNAESIVGTVPKGVEDPGSMLVYDTSHSMRLVQLQDAITSKHNDDSIDFISGLPEGHTVTCSQDGLLRVWQLASKQLEDDLKLWKKMVGHKSNDHITSGVGDHTESDTSIPKSGLNKPKYGKEDPDNTPHVKNFLFSNISILSSIGWWKHMGWRYWRI